MDSFLGLGTHVWIEVTTSKGERTTFSGYKFHKLLGIMENHKRDYDRESTRGSVVITPPQDICEEEWEARVIRSGKEIVERLDKTLKFNGVNPCGKRSGNCCTIARAIITRAGGDIPQCKFKGFSPGLVGIFHLCD